MDRVVAGVLLLAAGVRFLGLETGSLWFDEALSSLIARLTITQVLTNVAGSSHPPGYYLLLHFWRPLGESEYALRFPSAWCSLLAVALVARLGRDLFGWRTARLAALGMAISPFQVYYAQEVRMYGPAIALSAGLIWMFLRGVREHSPWSLWVYGVLAALGFYVHYYVAFVVLALHLGLLLGRARMQRLPLSLLGADLLAALAFAPQLTQFRTEVGEFLGNARWRVLPSPLEPIRTLYYLLFGHVMPLWVVPIGLFAVLSVLAVGVLRMVRLRERAGLSLLLVVLVPIIVVLFISLFVTPMYVERSFGVVTPALVLLLARVVGSVSRGSPVPYLGAVLVVLMLLGIVLLHVSPDPAKPPIREAAALVAEKAQPTDRVVHLQDASYLPALYYTPDIAGVLLDAGQDLWLTPQIYALFNGQVVQPVDAVRANRVWLTVMPGYLDSPQQGFLDSWRATRLPALLWDRGSVQVELYVSEQR